MSDLTPEDRALLDLARGGHQPTNEDRTRIRGALLARIGVGTGIVGTTAVTSKAATTMVLWTKVAATVVLTGAIGSAGVATYHHAMRPARMHVVATSSAGAAAETPTGLRGANTPPVTPDPVVGLPDLDERPGAHAIVPTDAVNHPPAAKQAALLANAARASADVTAPSDAPSAMPPPLAPLAPTTLEAETRLVRAGVAALHSGDSAHALALFDEHARVFPRGALAEERAAERVIALGELRRCDEARAAAASFLRDHPRSPLAARVRAACSATPNP